MRRCAAEVKTTYSDQDIEADVSAFLTEPWRSLAEADVVVARSGAAPEAP